MVTEVHEMSETLIKIKAGTLSTEEFDSINFDSEIFHSSKGKQYENDYGDDYSDEIYGHEYGSHNYKDDDEYDYGIGNHKVIQKTLNKKGKNKMTPK